MHPQHKNLARTLVSVPALWLLAATAGAWAQEELPAPAPDPKPSKTQAPATKAKPAPAASNNNKAPAASKRGAMNPAPANRAAAKPAPKAAAPRTVTTYSVPFPGFFPPGPLPPGIPSPPFGPRGFPLPGFGWRVAVDPQRQTERRERLRALGVEVLDAVGPQLAAVGSDQPGAIDVSKLNEGLKVVIASLLGKDTSVESLRIRLDPQRTNLAEDRLALEADAVLRRTAWSDLSSQGTLSLSGQVARAEDGQPLAMIDGRMRLQTPVVPLSNYLLEQYKARRAKSQASATPAAPSEDDLFLSMLDERLASVDRLETLDDVADLLTGVSGLRLTAMSQQLEDLRIAARSASDPQEKARLAEQLSAARARRDRLFDIRPKIERGPDQAARVIAIEMVGSELFAGADMQALDVRLTDREVTVSATVALTRWVELYPLIKPLAMGLLARIQSGDARVVEEVRPWVDGALGNGPSLIFGEPK